MVIEEAVAKSSESFATNWDTTLLSYVTILGWLIYIMKSELKILVII